MAVEGAERGVHGAGERENRSARLEAVGRVVLHGATTAVFALLAKMLMDRHPGRPTLALAPGLLAAACVHSVYTHFLVSPLLAAGVILVGLPLLVVAVFERSERATREWLEAPVGDDVRANLRELRYPRARATLWQVLLPGRSRRGRGRAPAPRGGRVSRGGSGPGSRHPGTSRSGR